MNRASRSLGTLLLAFWQAARNQAGEGRQIAGGLPASLGVALNRSPGSQRGIAIAAMLMSLPLLARSGVAWPGVWIAVLVGGGFALMSLPAAIGWSNAAVARLAVLMMASGLGVVIALINLLPADPALAATIRQAALIGSALAALVSLSMVFQTRRLGRILGTLALPLSAALAIASGAALLLLGVTAWPALKQSEGSVAVAMALAGAVWIAAFLCNRFEARRGLRWAGRLVGLRSGMIRLASMLGGVAVAQIAAPWLKNAAWQAAIATPLEGLAPIAGLLAGMCLGLAVAGIGVALPGLLGRLQLGGRINPVAAGEIAWFAAWMLLLASGAWFVEVPGSVLTLVAMSGLALFPVGRDFAGLDAAAAHVALAYAAVLVHGAVRILLGRPAPSAGTPLWLVLPSTDLLSAGLRLAEQMAREWKEGPVTLLAPPSTAARVRGAHLRLAQSAGSAADLFLLAATDANTWQHGPPAEQTREVLQLREAYATAAAARALMVALAEEARVLVLADGRLAAGWAAALATLPEHAERYTRLPPSLDRQLDGSWKEADFGTSTMREHLIVDFFVKHRPRPAEERRMLILHGASDSALAEQLARALCMQTDAQGRRIVATVLQPATSASAALAWSAGTWLTLLALFDRHAQRGGLGAFGRLIWRFLPEPETRARTRRFDLLVIESGMAETEARASRGLENMVDTVVGLTPAMRPHDMPTLYARTAYTAQLALPAPSALRESMPQLVHQLIDIEPGSTAA